MTPTGQCPSGNFNMLKLQKKTVILLSRFGEICDRLERNRLILLCNYLLRRHSMRQKRNFHMSLFMTIANTWLGMDSTSKIHVKIEPEHDRAITSLPTMV